MCWIQSAPKILLAMGMLVVIIAGGMDMTVGRLAGLGAVIAGTLAQRADYYPGSSGGLGELPIIVPMLVSVAAGLMVGAVTGIIISKFGFRPFSPDWEMQLIIYGGNLLFLKKAPNNSQPLAGYKQSFVQFGTGSFMGISYLIIVALLL